MQDESAVLAVAGHPPLPRPFIRIAFGVSVALVFFLVLSRRLAETKPSQVLFSLGEIAPENWFLAICFAAISFAAIGEYDRLFHRINGTSIPDADARATGMAAMALAQMLGLGVLSGALVRWRLVASFDLWQATRFSALVSASFLIGFGFFTACAILVASASPFLPPQVQLLSKMVLASGAIFVVGCVVLRRVVFRGRVINLPPVARLARLFSIVLIDCLGAAACAYILIPTEVAISFSTFLPVFLIAFGSGLISGTPAGVGPFELALLAMIHSGTPDESLLAAALAFRLVYFVVPAILAMVLLFRDVGARPKLPPAYATAPLPPEAYLARQGWFDLRSSCQVTQLLSPTGQALVSLRDAAGSPATALKVLSKTAKSQDRFPCLYKTGARSAVIARSAGYTTLRIAEEAIINTSCFDLSAPSRAGLRRKLRKANAAGVRVARAETIPSLAWLTTINSEWVACHGAERGFSIGRFLPDQLASRIVLVASQDDCPIGFVTFAVESDHGETIWRLDLMRHVDIPAEGTMHALVAHAIALARDMGAARLSLAAAPSIRFGRCGNLAAPSLARAESYVARCLGGDGLRQFKQSFAPVWVPLYIAAPGPLRLCIAAAEICAAIARPGPLPPSVSNDCRFALNPAPCHSIS